MYLLPSRVPGTYQSRPDSAPNKPYNCGPASVVHTARFYKDRDYGINATRQLGCPHTKVGTYPYERQIMFEKLGIKAKADRYSIPQLVALLHQKRWGTASFHMAKIPSPYRQYSFTGYHEMAIVGVKSGDSPDIAVMDPNYGWPDGSTGYRPQYIWLPFAIWSVAYKAAGGWAVIADAAKVIPSRRPYVKKCTVTSNGVNVRTGPGLSYTRVTSLSRGATFISTKIETKGGRYVVNGVTRRDWLAFIRNGRTVWIARAFVREA